MTERYADLTARIGSVGQLGNVVGALRGIAAAHARRSRGCLAGVRSYADTVATAIAHALALLPPEAPATASLTDGVTLLVLFCAEQGFAGGFSEQVFDAAAADLPDALLLVVGRRGQRVAAARGVRAESCMPMISQVTGAAGLADRIADEMYRRIGKNRLTRAVIVFSRPRDGAAIDIERRSLLPLDLQRFGRAPSRPPLVQLPPALLLERLAAEYLRAELAEAILHSFAAENTARMTVMSAARDNISRTLDGLTREARIARQEAITAELIELASGSGARFPRA